MGRARRLWLAVLALAWVLCGIRPALAAEPSKVRLGPESGGPYTVQVLSWKDIPFRTVERQQHDFSCGAAAVATLLSHHYGRPTREDQVFQVMWRAGDQAEIQSRGFSMLDMKRYLGSLGYRADGYKLGLDELARLATPAVAMIQIGAYRHFVVVKGVRGGKVLIGDPALGQISVEAGKFQAIWNGIVLVIHDLPAGAPAPLFNDDAEWSPWATAPTRASLPRWAMSELLMAQPPLYQLTPEIFVNLANPVSGP